MNIPYSEKQIDKMLNDIVLVQCTPKSALWIVKVTNLYKNRPSNKQQYGTQREFDVHAMYIYIQIVLHAGKWIL